MEKSNLNFAIVGCGRIAHRHAEHILQIGNLVAVCEINMNRSIEFAEKFKTKSYIDIDDMLSNADDIDVVSVCTPNGMHCEHAVKALKAGKHVLVEKPMALSVADCELMIKAAEEANKRLFVIKQNRFNPPINALKKLLDQNKLGKIFSIQMSCFWNRNRDYYESSDWKGNKKLDGGTLYTQFSHFIDLLYWLFGDFTDVEAYLSNSNHVGQIEFEDSGVIIARIRDNMIATINFTVNSYRKNMEGSITVFGEKGTVKIGGQYLNVLEYQELENYVIEGIPESSPANDYGSYQGSMSNHDKVYANVVDVLLNGGTITTNFLDGLKTVQIIEKIYSKGVFV
jgi:UDP-N-acetyl-2-amino-2-deoxyglucuronate dehydrogenase